VKAVMPVDYVFIKLSPFSRHRSW